MNPRQLLKAAAVSWRPSWVSQSGWMARATKGKTEPSGLRYHCTAEALAHPKILCQGYNDPLSMTSVSTSGNPWALVFCFFFLLGWFWLVGWLVRVLVFFLYKCVCLFLNFSLSSSLKSAKALPLLPFNNSCELTLNLLVREKKAHMEAITKNHENQLSLLLSELYSLLPYFGGALFVTLRHNHWPDYGSCARTKWTLRNGEIVFPILISINITLASKGHRSRLRVHYDENYTTRKTVLPHSAWVLYIRQVTGAGYRDANKETIKQCQPLNGNWEVEMRNA